MIKYDKTSEIILVSKEAGPAYSRVLLPYFLRGRSSHGEVFMRDADYYDRMSVQTFFNIAVTKVQDGRNTVILSNNQEITYDRLLIASGSYPLKPPIKNLEGPGVYHLCTLADAEHLGVFRFLGSVQYEVTVGCDIY